MTGDEVRAWLEGELSGFPKRTSGEEIYRSLVWQTKRLLEGQRSALADALVQWLKLRAEPRTMLAIDIAAAHHLKELRSEIEGLLEDVKAGGEVFKPYYIRLIPEALSRI